MNDNEKENVIEEETEITDEDLGDLVDDESEEEEAEVANSEEKPKKKPQSKEKNSYYAELRRKNKELEEKNKSLETKVKEADFSARKKIVRSDTMAELGIDTVTDENDLLLCEEYEKAVRSGSENPVADANKALMSKIRNEQKQLKEKSETDAILQKKIDEDTKEFINKFKFNPTKVWEDEVFMDMYGDQISGGNLTSLYSKYVKYVKNEGSNNSKHKGVIPNSSTQPPKPNDGSELEGNDFINWFSKKYGG